MAAAGNPPAVVHNEAMDVDDEADGIFKLGYEAFMHNVALPILRRDHSLNLYSVAFYFSGIASSICPKTNRGGCPAEHVAAFTRVMAHSCETDEAFLSGGLSEKLFLIMRISHHLLYNSTNTDCANSSYYKGWQSFLIRVTESLMQRLATEDISPKRREAAKKCLLQLAHGIREFLISRLFIKANAVHILLQCLESTAHSPLQAGSMNPDQRQPFPFLKRHYLLGVFLATEILNNGGDDADDFEHSAFGYFFGSWTARSFMTSCIAHHKEFACEVTGSVKPIHDLQVKTMKMANVPLKVDLTVAVEKTVSEEKADKNAVSEERMPITPRLKKKQKHFPGGLPPRQLSNFDRCNPFETDLILQALSGKNEFNREGLKPLKDDEEIEKLFERRFHQS